MTKGDDIHPYYFHLISFKIMATNKNEKAFIDFMPFESDECKKILREKKASEFPQLTTAKGETILHRLIKWVHVEYRGREFDVPVVACECGNKPAQITLAGLFGKPFEFVVDRESGNYKKGEKITIDNLVPFSEELNASPTDRNIAVMEKIQDGMKIKIVNVFGHFDKDGARSNNMTIVTTL